MDRSDCSTAANDQADEAHVEDCLDTNHDARAGGTSTAEKQCRICFSGPEEEDALGRLISPCMCTGSMRYVHGMNDFLSGWLSTAKSSHQCRVSMRGVVQAPMRKLSWNVPNVISDIRSAVHVFPV